MKLSTKLKKLHKLMTWGDIAEKLHVAESSVWYWAHGQRNPRYHVSKAIDELFEKHLT